MIRYSDTDKPRTGANDIVTKVKRWQQDSSQWVGQWEKHQDKWHRMRMRIKKKKSFPFSGCSNLRMPTIEIKIRKLKAALTNVIFGIRPVVQVTPSPSGNWNTAMKIEKLLDHLIMDVIQIKPKSIIAIDKTLEVGFYLMKPFWKLEITTRVEELSLDDLTLQEAMWFFDANRTKEEAAQAIAQRLQADISPLVKKENKKEIERIVEEIFKGKENIKFELQDVLYNCPDVSLCPPERVYVPTTTGYSPKSAQYIIHEFYLPLNTLKQNAKHKKWDITAVDKIEVSKELDIKEIDTTKDVREGIERLQSTNELVKIWECYCWHDINDDGIQEKCVITLAPDFNEELRKITLPFYSGDFPFIKFYYELIDDRWFSHRGIPELIEDIVKEIDIQHMQKVDRQTLTNSPMFVYRTGIVNPKTTQFVFGQGIGASGMQSLDDMIKPLNLHNSNIDFSYEREQMILETKVEELIGQVDFTLQSMINKREPRTLGEVQLQQQNMQQVFSLDADMFRENFADLFTWIYNLWCQYGDDSYEFIYLGMGESKGEKIKLSREEVQGKYKITVRGNDQNTNPQVRLQKAQAIMTGAQNQIALQAGVITPIHIAQAYKRFYQELDVPNWEELVSTPEQIMQQMQQAQQQAEQNKPDDIKIKAEDLTDAEIAQALKKRGISPDTQGRFMNEENRREKMDDEQITKLLEIMNKGGKSGK